MGDFDTWLAGFRARRPFLPGELATRLVRDYGTRAQMIVDGATTLAGLGEDFGAGLTQAEVDYLVTEEFAQTSADIVWRRSKLGLRLSKEDVARLDGYLEKRKVAA